MTTVTMTTKFYQGVEFVSEPVKMALSLGQAAIVLRRYAQCYDSVETVNGRTAGQPEAKFWFREQGDQVMLVRVSGVSLDEMLVACREAVA